METTKNFNAALEYFRDEGYRPQSDETRQTIEFYKGGERFRLRFDADEPCFYRLEYPDFWLTADEDDWRCAKRAALQVNRLIKCACVDVGESYNADATATIKAELFCDSVDSFLKVWPRLVGAIQAARSEFAKVVREIQAVE